MSYFIILLQMVFHQFIKNNNFSFPALPLLVLEYVRQIEISPVFCGEILK
jgi:hypothetical protein